MYVRELVSLLNRLPQDAKIRASAVVTFLEKHHEALVAFHHDETDESILVLGENGKEIKEGEETWITGKPRTSIKMSELKRRVELMRRNYEDTERKLMNYRNENNTGITVAECEARGGYHVCNCFLGFLDMLVYEQEATF